jgi:hypothetical protein
MDMQKEQQRVTSQERQTTQKLKADLVKNIVKPQPGGIR